MSKCELESVSSVLGSVASDHITGRSALSDFSDADDNEEYYTGHTVLDRSRTMPISSPKSEHVQVKRSISGESSGNAESLGTASSCYWQPSRDDDHGIETATRHQQQQQTVVSSIGTTPTSLTDQEAFCECDDDEDDVIAAIAPTATATAAVSKQRTVVGITMTSSPCSKVVGIAKPADKFPLEASPIPFVQMRKPQRSVGTEGKTIEAN